MQNPIKSPKVATKGLEEKTIADAILATPAQVVNVPENGDVITIIRDPARELGKRFTKNGKESAVRVSLGIAVQRHVPTADALAKVLLEVSEDEHAALINSGFKDIPIGEEFLILSEREIEKRTGFKTRDEQKGVHLIEYKGHKMKAVGRFKETTTPSRWVLLDRDVDKHTPAQFGTGMNFEQWIEAVETLMPGVDNAPAVRTQSSSSRVLKDGQPVGQGNGHVWVQIADAQDADKRLRVALMVRAVELGLSWIKFNKHGKSGRHTTLVDTSVFIRGRLVFCGKPTASDGMEVIAQTVETEEGMPLDTSMIVLPGPDKVRELTRKAGVEMSLRYGADGGLAVDAYDLTLDTVIELEDGTLLPVAEAAERLTKAEPKLRCQTPFRDSVSVAAFLSRGSDDKLFIYDVGDDTRHWQTNDDYALAGFDDLNAAALAVRDEARSLIETLIVCGGLTFDSPEEIAEEIKKHIAAADYNTQERDSMMKRLALSTGKTENEVNQSIGAIGRPRFASVPLSELLAIGHTTWFIKGVLPRAELGVLFGESGAGKSFMVLDMAMCIARGIPWRDRKVHQGRVTYIVAEGKAGFSPRLAAYAKQHEVDLAGVPFSAITDVPNFLSKVDHVALATQINAEGGADLIIVDTLAQTTPGASENSSEDMGTALAHCRRLAASTGAMVLLIHHAGKDLSRGARGWSGMKAAADVELCVSRTDSIRYLEVTKLKDGSDHDQFAFKLTVVPLGLDPDGDVFDSCVIEHTNEAVITEKKVGGKVQRAVLVAVRDLVGLGGDLPTEEAVVAHVVEQFHANLPDHEKWDAHAKSNKAGGVRKSIEAMVRDEVLAKIDGRLSVWSAEYAETC